MKMLRLRLEALVGSGEKQAGEQALETLTQVYLSHTGAPLPLPPSRMAVAPHQG